jgi:hypothetical protein
VLGIGFTLALVPAGSMILTDSGIFAIQQESLLLLLILKHFTHFPRRVTALALPLMHEPWLLGAPGKIRHFPMRGSRTDRTVVGAVADLDQGNYSRIRWHPK